MAKQGLLKFERNFGNVIFYRRCGKWFFRKHSSLSSKTVKTAQAFANTRASARRLSIASRVAASVYRKLPESWKMFEFYQKLTGIATRLQKEGKTVTQIRPLLVQQLYDWGYRREIEYPTIKPTTVPIVIRSVNECQSEEEAQLTKHVKQEKQQTTQSIKRKVRAVSRKYWIRRTRKNAIRKYSSTEVLNFTSCTFNHTPSGIKHLEMTSQSNAP